MDSEDIIRKFNSYKRLENSVPADIANLPFIFFLDSAPVSKKMVKTCKPFTAKIYFKN